MPVDPGNLLLIGTAKGHPVIAAPGCARSPKENGLNTHTEALEPMAGALWTSYDASFPAMGGRDEKTLQDRRQTS